MDEEHGRPEKLPGKPWKKIGKIILYALSAVVIAIMLVLGITALRFPQLAKAGYNFLTVSPDKVSSSSGKVNILVMGKSGGVNAGPDLTDTMILVSISLGNSGIKMVSIPRDMWIPEIAQKINSAYYWGKTGSSYIDAKASGGGIGLAKKITQDVVGQPIQYGIVIDFTAFKDIVDALGGIEVNVENGFTDKLYPIASRENDTCGGDPTFTCRYQTVTFSPGFQKMDGATALIFVRSRHAEGIEGTDIAREARQQKVIDAIKAKITQPKTFLSPRVVAAILNIAKKYIETDMDLPTAGTIARFVLNGKNDIAQFLIPDSLLINPPVSKVYDKLYVFIPKLGNGKWGDINGWFASVLGN